MFLSSISYADHLDLHSFPTRRSSDLIREENWIQRSVALSRESNEKIVNLSIQHLKDKKELTNNPHKIIAVACSIKHAEDIQKIYKEKGYESSIVHSELEK